MNVSRASQLQSELKREREERKKKRGTEFNEYKQGQTA